MMSAWQMLCSHNLTWAKAPRQNPARSVAVTLNFMVTDQGPVLCVGISIHLLRILPASLWNCSRDPTRFQGWSNVEMGDRSRERAARAHLLALKQHKEGNHTHIFIEKPNLLWLAVFFAAALRGSSPADSILIWKVSCENAHIISSHWLVWAY